MCMIHEITLNCPDCQRHWGYRDRNKMHVTYECPDFRRGGCRERHFGRVVHEDRQCSACRELEEQYREERRRHGFEQDRERLAELRRAKRRRTGVLKGRNEERVPSRFDTRFDKGAPFQVGATSGGGLRGRRQERSPSRSDSRPDSLRAQSSRRVRFEIPEDRGDSLRTRFEGSRSRPDCIFSDGGLPQGEIRASGRSSNWFWRVPIEQTRWRDSR